MYLGAMGAAGAPILLYYGQAGSICLAFVSGSIFSSFALHGVCLWLWREDCGSPPHPAPPPRDHPAPYRKVDM